MEHLSIRPAYRFAEFCREFGIGRSAAYREIAEGRLTTYKVGKLTMVAGEDALAWRDGHRQAPPWRGRTGAGLVGRAG
jgi:hypothetical protein